MFLFIYNRITSYNTANGLQVQHVPNLFLSFHGIAEPQSLRLVVAQRVETLRRQKLCSDVLGRNGWDEKTAWWMDFCWGKKDFLKDTKTKSGIRLNIPKRNEHEQENKMARSDGKKLVLFFLKQNSCQRCGFWNGCCEGKWVHFVSFLLSIYNNLLHPSSFCDAPRVYWMRSSLIDSWLYLEDGTGREALEPSITDPELPSRNQKAVLYTLPETDIAPWK